MMTEAQASIAVRLLGLTAASWVMSILQMYGMAQGSATALGSFGHFFPLWVTMMAAMMLPGALAPLVTQADVRTAPQFVLAYLGVWAAIGVLAYVAYRPHGTTAAGAIVLAAGMYELTPLKRRCRRQCRKRNATGLGFGIACVGSTAGLMAVLLAISPMSVPWMAGLTALAVIQKILPAHRAIDIPVTLAIVGLGLWILFAPSSVPGLIAHM